MKVLFIFHYLVQEGSLLKAIAWGEKEVGSSKIAMLLCNFLHVGLLEALSNTEDVDGQFAF